jgi:hypothetical protein
MESMMTAYVQTQTHGGGGGSPFSDDLTQACRLVRVAIRHGSEVDGIQGTYVTPDGIEFTGNFHGGSGGSPSEFTLDSDEYINGVAGRSADRVDQLTFITNKGHTYGPYGGDGGSTFSISNLKVGGFFGRSGSRLDAIGFFDEVNCP